MLRVRGTEKGALLLTADRKRNRKSNIQISLSDTVQTAVSALPPGRKNVLPRRKRVPFFVSCGSLTVEAALAVPLFFFCVIALVCLMEMYGLYVRKLTVLQQRAESAGIFAASAGSDSVPVIDLTEEIPFQVRGIPLFRKTVRIAVRARVRPWTGRNEADNGGQEKEGEKLVYVTDYRSVYHTSSRCSHLNLQIKAMSSSQLSGRRNTYGARYHACDKCVGKGGKNHLVYITPDGDCYHNSAECSGLKRTTHLVPESEVKGMRECSRCQAAGNG